MQNALIEKGTKFSGVQMDKVKATEIVELALQALRELEEAVRESNRHRISLETEVLRDALFSILEMVRSENDK